MKQTLKRIIRTVKSVKGNSLAEFATTTALMATLAATAAPKLSEMSEGAKAEKSRNELDKLVKQAGQFYQDTADIEGRGRFPGQDKYDRPVTGTAHASSSSADHETAILADLITDGGTFDDYRDGDGADWVSVFATDNPDFPKPTDATLADNDTKGTCEDCPGTSDSNDPSGNTPSIHVDADGNYVSKNGHEEWKILFGGEVVGSQYQDGHFVYQVVKGGGTGDEAYPPVLYVADIENATDFNNLLEP